MSDVLLQQTNDGGEINIDATGNIQLDDTPSTSVYNSLFGGGGWWADLAETDSNLKLTGECGQLVKGLPAFSSNLLLIEQAAERDLAWMLNIGAASSVEVEASLGADNVLAIEVNLEYDGQQVNLIYSLNWTA